MINYLLLKFFHFNDNHDPEYDVNSEERDKLHKICPFLKLIQDNVNVCILQVKI